MTEFTDEQIALGAQRLNELADFLEKLPMGKFDYDSIIDTKGEGYVESLSRVMSPNCGTTCCAMGWMPAVWPHYWHWKFAQFEGEAPHLGWIDTPTGEEDLFRGLSHWFFLPEEVIGVIFYRLSQSDIWSWEGSDSPTMTAKALVAVLRLVARNNPQNEEELVMCWENWHDGAAKQAIYADIEEASQ